MCSYNLGILTFTMIKLYGHLMLLEKLYFKCINYYRTGF